MTAMRWWWIYPENCADESSKPRQGIRPQSGPPPGGSPGSDEEHPCRATPGLFVAGDGAPKGDNTSGGGASGGNSSLTGANGAAAAGVIGIGTSANCKAMPQCGH